MTQFTNQLAKLRDLIPKVFSESGSAKNTSGMFQAFSVGFNTLEGLLSSSTGQSSAKSVNLIQRATKVCTQLENLYKNVINSSISADDQKRILSEVDSLIESAQPLAAAGSYASNGMSMQSATEKVPASTFQGKHGNERFKAYMNLELLRDAQTRSDKMFEDVIKFQTEMKDLVTRMSRLDLEIVQFKDIIQLIKEGIIILAKIREQWSKLIQFFSMVSVRAKVALNQTLTPFIEMSIVAGGQLSKQDRQFFKEILLKQAVDIHKVAYYLYTLSKTYVDISGRFLLDRLAGLGKMVATTDEATRRTMINELDAENDNAQSEIKRIAGEKRRAYKQLVEQRIHDVKEYVQQLGGPSTKDEEAARKGIEVIKAKENDSSTNVESYIYG